MIKALTAAALLAGSIFFSGQKSFFCFIGFLLTALAGLMDFYAVEEKKNENKSSGNEGSATEPQVETTNPESAQFGSPTGTTTTGEVYVRGNEQAETGDYTNPKGPADTVKKTNVAPDKKQGAKFELQINEQ